MKSNCKVRLVALDDAPKLLELYTPFVISEDSNISDVSFEYVAPTLEEFSGRIREISAGYPYLVCERAGEILGYVYAHPYIKRAAYQWGAEVTVYLAPAGQGLGLGRVLYTALEDILRLQGIVTLYACITASNDHSVGMHASLGYKTVGSFSKTGFKHGHWLDMVWMEKKIAEHPEKPEPIRTIGQVAGSAVAEILERASAQAGLLLK